MKHAMLLLPFALAACNSAPTVTATNASVGDVAQKVQAAQASGQFVSPGHWDATMTIDKMEMPGMPPEAAARMKGMMGKGSSFASCLTPAEAAKPKEDFFGGKGNNGCRYDHFTMGGGVIDAAMKCSGEGAMRTMTIKGTYSPDTYHVDVASEGGGADGAHGMSMAMSMDARRTGACTGKEDD